MFVLLFLLVLPYLQTINLQCRKRKHAVVATGNVGCKAVHADEFIYHRTGPQFDNKVPLRQREWCVDAALGFHD